jgi:hypothetical protein
MAAVLTRATPTHRVVLLLKRNRSERGPAAYRLGYVDDRRNVRTQLAAIFIVPLMHIVGNIHEEIGHIRGHGVQHPGEKKQQRHKQDDHFRNKRERGFVQLRHSLERTDGQADKQTEPQNRRRHQQRRF